MNGDFIEAALHVQAMRLVCKALADREQQGIEVDWCVLRQMYDQMDAMLQALQHKHRYDSSDMVDLRKDRDAARAEIETLRGAMAADDKRLRDAEQKVWPGLTWGCDAPDKMADAILHQRQQLAEQQAETVDVRRQRNNETDRLNATNAVSVQQCDEIAYLRARLDEERSVIAGLRQQLRTAAGRVDLTEENNRSLREQLDAANAAVFLQRAGIERLQKCVGKVRTAILRYQPWCEALNQITAALAELDAEPTPVAEPLDAEGGA